MPPQGDYMRGKVERQIYGVMAKVAAHMAATNNPNLLAFIPRLGETMVPVSHATRTCAESVLVDGIGTVVFVPIAARPPAMTRKAPRRSWN